MNGNDLNKEQPYLVVSATPVVIVDPESSLLIHRNYISNAPCIGTVKSIKIVTWLKHRSEIEMRGHYQAMLKGLIFEQVSKLI